MHLEGHEQFVAVAIKDRLFDVLGNYDFGNGTSVAEALFTAFLIDLRRTNGGTPEITRLINLSDDEIREQACDLILAYGERASEFTLPLGTTVVGDGDGAVKYGSEVWLCEAGRAGLHPLETARRDAHGPNLDLLRSHIDRLTRRLACRRLGLPEPKLVVDTDERNLLIFPPLVDAGGVVLQRRAEGTQAPRFCAARPDQIQTFAEEIVADMRTLWKRRREIGARAQAVRTVAHQIANQHGAAVSMVTVDLALQDPDAAVGLYVLYDGIDVAMRPGTVLSYFGPRDNLQSAWRFAPEGISSRREELAQLQRLGADGRIDTVAQAVASIAPQGTAAVLAELASSYDVTFTVQTRTSPLYATLFWKDGVIRAEISKDRSFEWFGNNLMLYGQAVSSTLLASIPGRDISSIVELPFALHATILDANERGSALCLKLQVNDRLLNLRTARIWG